ncbi:hypothetical protein FNV43_RR05223 [Rhamnella rubrinervis]|uniref:Bromo domain-containing protein n=1 Tax=Rhamnella rubrinervis TaxID=2594499 RepID=A0A8K0MRD5_9ROSA|nr:hypothetical protein FNV43_RR05223 [Rhamnella rubrinervis]
MLKEEAVIEEQGERRKSARILALVEEKKRVKQKCNNSSAAISANTNKVSNINKDVGDKSKAVLVEQHHHHHAVLLSTKPETSPPPPPLPPPLPPLPPVKKGRKRKRLEDLDGENPKLESTSSKNDHEAIVQSTRPMPQRHILEFVLDILQRRDAHEIFAQPVDRQEVESYYKIIKEPMDFGTMRAKLQEGMYTSLEQFELSMNNIKLLIHCYNLYKQHDVFLISSNAMHFNSSTTIYYREAEVFQARGIQELAQRVFQALKFDPDEFDSHSLMYRNNPAIKTQFEARGSRTKLAKPGGVKTRVSPFGRPSSFSSPSLKKRVPRESSSPGPSDGKNSSLPEMDKRQTYKPWTSFSTQNEALVSSIYSAPKQLVHIDEGDLQYKESLLRFTKDLGPAAQIIAHKKLGKFLAEPPKHQSQIPLTPAMQNQRLLLPASRAPRRPVHVKGVCNHQMPNTSLRDVPGSSNVAYTNKGVNVHGHVSTGSGKITCPLNGGLNVLETSREGLVYERRDHSDNLQGKMNINAINGRDGKNAMQTEMDAAHPGINLNIFKGKEMAANTGMKLDILKGKQIIKNDNMNLHGNVSENINAHPHHQNQNNNFRLAAHFRVIRFEDSVSPGTSNPPRVGYKAMNMMAKTSYKMLGKQVIQPAQTQNDNHKKLLDFMSRSNNYLKSTFLPSQTALASQVLLASHALLSTQNFSPPPPKHVEFPSVLNLASVSRPTLNTEAQTSQLLDLSRPVTWGPRAVDNFPNLQMQTEDDKPVNQGTSLRQEIIKPLSSAMQGTSLYPADSIQERGIKQSQTGPTSQLYHGNQRQSLMDNQQPDLALQL